DREVDELGAGHALDARGRVNELVVAVELGELGERHGGHGGGPRRAKGWGALPPSEISAGPTRQSSCCARFGRLQPREPRGQVSAPVAARLNGSGEGGRGRRERSTSATRSSSPG